MPDTLAFSTIEVSTSKTLPQCAVCKNQSASFAYRIASDEPAFQQLDGYCCLKCGTNLLVSLESIVRARTQREKPGGSSAPKTN